MNQEKYNDIGEITIFKSIKDTDTPYFKEVNFVIDRIKQGTNKELIKKIRSEKDKGKRNELKKQLPAICFSGVFSKRNDQALIEHSGLICLDFDNYEKSKEMLDDREKLTKDKYVFSVFTSPSGNGLKVLIKIPPIQESHVDYFNGLETYFNNMHFDKSTKNLSRVCYESFDPNIFVNERSHVWTKRDERKYNEVVKHVDKPTIPISDENKIVDILVKWWTAKYSMAEGSRNQSAYILAMAFNDFGVNKSLALHVLHQYASGSFTIKEINRTVDSAYSNTANFGTKYYEDEDKMNNIRNKIKRGVSKKEVRYHLEESGYDNNLVEAVLTTIEEENNNTIFWQKNDKGKVAIVHILYKRFLEDSGFYKYCPSESKNFVFVRVKNNLIDHTTEVDIKDFVLNYLLELGDTDVYNYFADNTRFFKEEFLSLLGTIEPYFIADTKDEAYLYYLNCAVKVTQNKIELIDYLDFGALVWRKHVIDRNFSICKFSKDFDYVRFIENICAKDGNRITTMQTTIGFLMHGYKNMSYCPAVILNDEVISDNPEGGTGKGIFMAALGHIKKLVQIDGKTFSFDKNFPYQRVSADTQVLVFDDVKNHFDFERLFSIITEGITTEKKNKDEIRIPFERSPKVSITTNYAIKGAGNSFERRKWEVELHQYYNKSFTPIDEFGRLMFGDWSEEDWCEFDNYMIYCLQLYMYKGLVKSEFVNLSIRQLSASTSHEFIEWCGLLEDNQHGNIPLNERVYKHNLYNEFVNEYPDYSPKSRMTISRNKFYRWLHEYAVYKIGQAPEEGRDQHGRWIIINTNTLKQ